MFPLLWQVSPRAKKQAGLWQQSALVLVPVNIADEVAA
jgi:hypothetical protein